VRVLLSTAHHVVAETGTNCWSTLGAVDAVVGGPAVVVVLLEVAGLMVVVVEVAGRDVDGPPELHDARTVAQTANAIEKVTSRRRNDLVPAEVESLRNEAINPETSGKDRPLRGAAQSCPAYGHDQG
jgi:hypothetical protein